MSECKGCGTKLENCGAPIWEDYCPNEECHYEVEQFKIRLAEAGKESKKRKALEAAATELYEAMDDIVSSWSDTDNIDEDEYLRRISARAALAKARGEV